MRSKYLDKLLMGHLDINSIRNIFDAFPANIRLDEDVLKTSFVFVFRRRLDQDEHIRYTHTSSKDVFKTSSRHLDQDQYIRLDHTSSIGLQEVFKTSSRRLAKISSKRLQGVFKTSSRRLQDVFKASSRRFRDVLKTSSRRLAKMSLRRFQNV